jgi:hypothetical protein
MNRMHTSSRATACKGILWGTALLLLPGTASAANPESLSINYQIPELAKLTITPATINFPDADPSLFPQVPAAENPITVTVKIRKTPTAPAATLVCSTGAPLSSGTSTIAAGNIRWTATGTGFMAGQLSSATPQTVGSWNSSGAHTGFLTFQLDNLWSYTTGTYSGSIQYTLTAP